MPSLKKDNSALPLKLALRREAISACGVERPFVLDAFAGLGEIHRALYSPFRGVACEIDADRATRLAFARPTWTCLNANSVDAIRAGLLSQYRFDLIDLDAYGNPWPSILAILEVFNREITIAVTDGMRSKIKISDGFGVETIRPMVERYGSSLHARYLPASRWRLENEGARVLSFRGSYAGANKAMTCWWARIAPTRKGGSLPSPSSAPASDDRRYP